jgi:hypothetical protein
MLVLPSGVAPVNDQSRLLIMHMHGDGAKKRRGDVARRAGLSSGEAAPAPLKSGEALKKRVERKAMRE